MRCDYRETLSDLMIEEVFPLWIDWCKKRGIATRNQAHGAPVNLLDFYAIADIPETEMFGHGGPDPLVSRFDENLGKADREPLISKFASSAAHTAGKPRVASETGTWLAEHFCESFEELKGLVDLMFLSGVNDIFYHGCVYSPDDAAWPGWLFYAATEMNPRNPLWREAPTLNRYIERSQSILREGRPDNDVLLYWPIHEIWSSGKTFQFTVHRRKWLTEEPVGAAARFLWEKGYGFDYISDRLLMPMQVADGEIRGADRTAWRAVLVPECRQMPLASIEKLFALAEQGATVLFENRLPEDIPGLGTLDDRRRQLRERIGKLTFGEAKNGVREALLGAGRVRAGPLEPLLKTSGIVREQLVDHPGLKFVRRTTDHGRCYFLVNHNPAPLDAWVPLATRAVTVEAMDPLSGDTGAVPVRVGPDGNPEVALRIEPGHSLILRTFAAAKTVPPLLLPRPGADETTIKGPWQVEFLTGGPALPKPFVEPVLKSWTENGDPATSAFAGTSIYRTTFDFNGAGDKPWLLDLGEVRHVARIKLNGRALGSLIMHPYRLLLPPGSLHAKGNRLEVEVSNLGANRLRDLDRRKVPWKIFRDINFANIGYKPFDASAWPVMESGLLGPVRLRSVDGNEVGKGGGLLPAALGMTRLCGKRSK